MEQVHLREHDQEERMDWSGASWGEGKQISRQTKAALCTSFSHVQTGNNFLR